MIVESKRDAEGIRTITLNRPPANAINYEMMEAVFAAFHDANKDWKTKVVVLESSNSKFFSAGMDIKEARPPQSALPAGVPQYGMELGRDVFRCIYECGVPVIAKVQGIAVGAGFLYACLADFVVASESAQFGQFEIKVGAVGGAGMLRRVLSEQAMRYLTWTADLVSVQQLTSLGAGIHVVPDSGIASEVDRIAKLLASRSDRLSRHTKLAMNQVEMLGPIESYSFEQMHSESLFLRQMFGDDLT